MGYQQSKKPFFSLFIFCIFIFLQAIKSYSNVFITIVKSLPLFAQTNFVLEHLW